MKKISNLVSSFLILFSMLLTPDCATITRRSKQRIPATSDPMGATVIVNGVPQGVTPLEIRLARKEKGQVIRIESPGYNPIEIRPKRKMSAGPIAGNFLLGLIPGAVPATAYAMYHDDEEGDGTRTMLIWMLAAQVVILSQGWELFQGTAGRMEGGAAQVPEVPKTADESKSAEEPITARRR